MFKSVCYKRGLTVRAGIYIDILQKYDNTKNYDLTRNKKGRRGNTEGS